MAERLDPATRPTRLSLATHFAVVFLLGLSFVSGVLIWRGQSLQTNGLETPAWLHACIVVHGALNPFQCALFGYLCCEHIRLGWRLKANLLTGFTMEFLYAGLILSGVGLYYADSNEWRSFWVVAHRIMGLLLPAGL